jgi:protein involved in polysaccharide export with SLBB domain
MVRPRARLPLALAALLGLAFAANLRAQLPAQAPPDVLAPGDAMVVRIDNLGGRGLPAYREIVDSEGRIELPYLGMIDAAGKSLPALQEAMAAAYAAARIADEAVVHLTYVARFSPAPARDDLVRAHPARRPAPIPPEMLKGNP